MTRKSFSHLHCSWAQASEAVGDKWSMMIIREAFYGERSFSAFAKNLGIAKNILSQRLAHLQEHDILVKRPGSANAVRQEYYLTKKGLALFPVIIALGQWGDEWIFEQESKPMEMLDRHSKQPIQRLSVTSADNRELGVKDVFFKAGPGAQEDTKEQISELNTRIDKLNA